MPTDADVEAPYLVPTHLRTSQTVGPIPSRVMFAEVYALLALGGPAATATWNATHLVVPTAAALLGPALLMSPFALPLQPPAEHGLAAMAGFVGRTFVAPPPAPVPQVAVYRMPTINLETSSVAARRAARAQWGTILNALSHPIKIIIRARPLAMLNAAGELLEHERPAARRLGAWLETQVALRNLIERERYLVVPARDEAELTFRAGELEKALQKVRLNGQRVSPDELPLLRTLTWNPRATEPRETPDQMEEGWTEALADGWWTRAYALGQIPASVLTNWASPLFAGDEPMDVAIDVVPQDLEFVKTWVLDVQIKRMESSVLDAKRALALEQLKGLRMAFEKRRVMPFEVAMTVVVRGNSRDDVRARGDRVVQRVKSTGARLDLLRWEQAAGLRQLDPTTTAPLWQRSTLIETGTVARTYPWSDGFMQLAGGVPWGEAGNQPCLFTPYVRTNRGPHMAWYGTTNAGKGTGAHMLWSRLHLIQGVRIFGIDQDEQHEHCGRFLEYLGGRRLTPRDALDAADIVLHPDDGAVILDLSEVDEDQVGPIFATWAGLVRAHMLAHPGRSILFVDEATRVVDDATGSGERALRDSFQRGRHWGQSSQAMTQRPTDWFDTRVGRAIQGNCDAWWCGGQQPREIDEVAKALRMTDEEKELVEHAAIGTGLLVSGGRRAWLDLFDKLSPEEYAAFNSDPVVVPISSARKEGVA